MDLAKFTVLEYDPDMQYASDDDERNSIFPVTRVNSDGPGKERQNAELWVPERRKPRAFWSAPQVDISNPSFLFYFTSSLCQRITDTSDTEFCSFHRPRLGNSAYPTNRILILIRML